MTYSRYGLTSRSLREAVAREVAEAYGYEAGDLLSEPSIDRTLQTSISAKGWTVYCGGRDSNVTWNHGDRSTAGNRRELVDEVADVGFDDWRERIADVMRARALRSAGETDWDAAPAWSVLVSPLMIAVGAAVGIPASRLSLVASGDSATPRFADLQPDEALGSTVLYERGAGAKSDWLRGRDGRPWWRLGHEAQLLADERFPIRSITVDAVETRIEMRHALPETQMLGLSGSPLGAVIGLAGMEVGTPGGDAPIRRVEHSDMWSRATLVVDTVHVAAAEAPPGVDTRWAEMFHARQRRRRAA